MLAPETISWTWIELPRRRVPAAYGQIMVQGAYPFSAKATNFAQALDGTGRPIVETIEHAKRIRRVLDEIRLRRLRGRAATRLVMLNPAA